MQRRSRVLAVVALAVAEEQVPGLHVAQRSSWRKEAQERMHSERLVRGTEVADAAEGVSGDQDSLGREPERDLAPRRQAHDLSHLERRTWHTVERSHVERDAQAPGDGHTVTAVTVEQLHDACGLAERPDPLVDAVPVDRISDPDTLPGQHCVRGTLEELVGHPAEAVLELVEEPDLHQVRLAAMFAERWDTAGGFRVHAYCDPDPTGKTPLVLVHGLGVSARYLLPTGERLLPHFAVYGPNLPGFGPSEKPRHPLDLAQLASVLGLWLDALGLEQPILLANSFGCQTAVELAVQRPDRLSRLVLVGPTVDRHARTILRQLFGLVRDGLSEPRALNALVVRDYLRAGPMRLWRTAQYALSDRIEDKLPSIDLPVLIVLGEHDGFVSERWARELAGRAPDGRLEIVPGAAHAVNFNSPDALAALVREFVIPGTRASLR